MLPKIVLEAWEERQLPFVLTTVDLEGVPNSIYVISSGLYEGTDIVIADNYFEKTRANIESGGKASVLFITSDGRPFQIKGMLTYHDSGPVYTFMRKVTPERFPRRAAVLLHPTEIYSGSERLF